MEKAYEIKIDEEIKPKKQAVPGVPWEDVKFKVNSKDFARTMRDNGFETYEDVRTNTQLVVSLLQRLYKVDLAEVMSFARQFEEDK